MAIKTIELTHKEAFEYDASLNRKECLEFSAQPRGNPNKKSRPGGNPKKDPEKTAGKDR